VLGTLMGVGFLAVGGYAILGADAGVADALRERAAWFGVTALIGGVWAIGVSWLDVDLSGVWCRPPRGGRATPKDF
jgi:hypothetical protein